MTDNNNNNNNNNNNGTAVEFTVEAEYSGLRLDKCISEKYEDITRSHIAGIIRSGNVFVNSRKARASLKVSEGDLVEFILPNEALPDIVPQDIPLDILYEDSDCIVVNKPKGMVVHPAPGHYEGTLVNALMYHVHDLSGINGKLRPGIVHRIDRDTTGSIIVCKNDRAHLSLARQLEEHSINRKYAAIVNGNLRDDTGTIDAPIGRCPTDRKKQAVVPGGRRAVTHYKVLQRFGNYTYVECALETGRTHQIRVHFAHIGHPVMGDEVYSRGKSKFNTMGQVLHAKTLGFIQPTTGEYIEVEAPLPEYFEKILKSL